MQASSPGCSCGGVGKEGELVTMSLEFNFTSNPPVALHRLSCQISASQRKVEMGKNVRKH